MFTSVVRILCTVHSLSQSFWKATQCLKLGQHAGWDGNVSDLCSRGALFESPSGYLIPRGFSYFL